MDFINTIWLIIILIISAALAILSVKNSLEHKMLRSFLRHENINGKKIDILKEAGKINSTIKVKIHHNINIDGDFLLSKEFFISKNVIIKDIKIYDNLFDKKVYITANQDSTNWDKNLIALLNKNVRDNILKLSEKVINFEITKDHISIIFKEKPYNLAGIQQNEIFKTALSISDNMTNEKRIRERLFKNIFTETNSEIRLMNLHYLNNSFSNNKKKFKHMMKELLTHKDENIQIIAAKQLEKEGLDHLFNILQNQWKNKNIDNPEIITYFGEKKYLKAIPLILKIYNGLKDSNLKGDVLSSFIVELKQIILSSFKDCADQKLSDFLVKELDNEEPKLREEAIRALGSCGNREAIEPLYKFNKSIINPLSKNLIQEAMSKIQSRLGEYDTGGLSIAEHAEKDGALSISNEEEEGGLSIADDKDKQDEFLQEEEGA